MANFGNTAELILTENQKASLPLKYNNSEGDGDFFGSEENDGIPFGEKKYSRASGEKEEPADY